MKNIFKILKFDLKNVAKNIIVFVVIIGIVILPALYSWFNIAANWDPYSNTAGLDFAVTAQDTGYEFKSIKVNAGDSIVSNLKQNSQMGWDFVSKKKAIDGVKSGKYYAAVIIPKDFSKNLFSLTTGDFSEAKLQYYSNEKKNAIAPKITDKGAEAIETAVKETYVNKITEVIATTLNLTEDTLSETKADVADKIVSVLNNTKDDLKDFNKTNDLFISTLNSVGGLIEANKDLEPGIKKAMAKAGAVGGDIKNILNGLNSSSANVTELLSNVLSQGSSYGEEIDDELTDAFNELSNNSDNAANKLSKITKINKKIIEINNKSLSAIQKISKVFPDLKFKNLTNLLNKANKKQNSIITKINNACDTIRKTGNLPKKTQNELKSEIGSAKSILSDVETSFSKVKKSIDNAADDTYDAIDDISDFVTSLGSGTSGLKKALNSGSNTVNNLKATFKNIKELVNNAEKKIDGLISKVKEIKNSKKIENFLTPIIENPEALGNFVSSPVETEKHTIFKVENYGSAMTPFYTSLGLWVGGVVLVALLSVTVNKEGLSSLIKPKQSQLFFGRYLIFFILGQLQALVIALGDLFFLKIQCVDPLLFIAASMISSFVYTLIIYSLTITFSVLGKALSVIILVIQVAGSGGTFPIEVLPAPFQTMAPFLPFKYGVNALREAVAGVDLTSYWTYIGQLMLFVIAALFVGLLLRKPCIKIIEFFNNRIEDSEIVI